MGAKVRSIHEHSPVRQAAFWALLNLALTLPLVNIIHALGASGERDPFNGAFAADQPSGMAAGIVTVILFAPLVETAVLWVMVRIGLYVTGQMAWAPIGVMMTAAFLFSYAHGFNALDPGSFWASALARLPAGIIYSYILVTECARPAGRPYRAALYPHMIANGVITVLIVTALIFSENGQQF